MEISAVIEQLNEELVELRRDFHRHPELGLKEFRTAEKIVEYLTSCGIEVETKRYNKTGVVGLIRGQREGPTLMLRADMDALPINELADVPYKSMEKGKMHACGHDGHVAMLLVAAKILTGYRNRIKGNIKLVFQPNEEAVGALGMIEEGVMESPKVDACLGLHLWTPIPTGQMAISAGPVMGGMDHFHIKLIGKGGHTANPQEAVDPIVAAANLITTLQTLQTREINALKPTVIMFGSVNSGTISNVIPENVEMAGTLRYLYDDSEALDENPRGRFERITKDMCRLFRVKHELTWNSHQPPLINDSGMSDFVREVATDILGDQNKIVSYVTMAGEDFAEFASRAPGMLCFIGAGNKDKDASYPHHHPCFNIDEDALKVGVELHVRSALKYCSV